MTSIEMFDLTLHFSGDRSVNPREIKRLINAYTMQAKMLSARLGEIDPNVVLALQCMSFRPDREELYETLTADPMLFQHEVRSAREGDVKEDVVWLAGKRVTLPQEFLQYIDTRARGLLNIPNLHLYVSAAESGRGTDPRLLEAHGIITRLRREFDQLPGKLTMERYSNIVMRPATEAAKVDTIDIDYRSLISTLERISTTQRASELSNRLKRFDDFMKESPKIIVREDFEAFHRRILGWAQQASQLLDGMDAALKEMRRQSSVGAKSAP